MQDENSEELAYLHWRTRLARNWRPALAAHWRTWLWRYVLPSLLLSVPWAAPWLFFSAAERAAGDADDLVLLLGFVVLPVVALLTGMLARPTQAWIAPLAALALLWLGIGVVQGRSEVHLEEVLATLIALAGPQAALIWLGYVVRDRLQQALSEPLHLPQLPRLTGREPRVPA